MTGGAAGASGVELVLYMTFIYSVSCVYVYTPHRWRAGPSCMLLFACKYTLCSKLKHRCPAYQPAVSCGLGLGVTLHVLATLRITVMSSVMVLALFSKAVFFPLPLSPQASRHRPTLRFQLRPLCSPPRQPCISPLCWPLQELPSHLHTAMPRPLLTIPLSHSCI